MILLQDCCITRLFVCHVIPNAVPNQLMAKNLDTGEFCRMDLLSSSVSWLKNENDLILWYESYVHLFFSYLFVGDSWTAHIHKYSLYWTNMAREVQLPLAQSNGMMDYGSHFSTSSSAFMTWLVPADDLSLTYKSSKMMNAFCIHCHLFIIILI